MFPQTLTRLTNPPSALSLSGINGAGIDYSLGLTDAKNLGNVIGWVPTCDCIGCCFRLCEIDYGKITVNLGGVDRSYEAITGWLGIDASTPDANKYKASTITSEDENNVCRIEARIVFGVFLGEDDQLEDSGYGPVSLIVDASGSATMEIGDLAFGGSWPSPSIVGTMTRAERVEGTAAGIYAGSDIGANNDSGTCEIASGTVVACVDAREFSAPF